MYTLELHIKGKPAHYKQWSSLDLDGYLDIK